MKTAVFLKEHPLCCFCGGEEPATTIDHQPAKIMFADKRRPKGLEFPACKVCNGCDGIGGVDECLVGLVARLTGSRRQEAAKPDSGMRRAMGTIDAAHPDLLKSLLRHMWDPSRQRMAGAFDLNHPRVHHAMGRIAAKMALATFYDASGRIAGPATRICTQWAHNQRQEDVELVSELLRKFPRGRQLVQGKWNTSDTFFIRYLWEGDVVQMAAVFHESVALMAQFIADGEARDWEKLALTWAPARGEGLKLVGMRSD